MTRFIIACSIAFLSGGTAGASEQTEVMAVVHQMVDGFNKGDMKSSLAACADQAVVVDDTPPHVWQGAGACAAWNDAFEAWAKTNEVTGVSEAIVKVRHIDISSDVAYVVQSVGLSWIEKGKPMSEKAIETVTLKKTAAGWRITGWAWADL
ncbi:MAG: nuclear transport factor 2 family protein [Steroidobacteraceae bacterium]|jgi:ketosteroid isomerase-like protein